MNGNPNTVKFPYHHGGLKTALMNATEEILAEKGVEGFSLREAARRAGVSPAASAHHFSDKRGLLTAVATRAFLELVSDLSNAAARSDTAVRAVAEAYVRFAADRPARFELMWRATLLDPDDRSYREAADQAFAVLHRTITGQQQLVDVPFSPESAPSLAIWSLVHGFATLLLNGVFGSDEGQVDRALTTLLPAVLDQAATKKPAASAQEN